MDVRSVAITGASSGIGEALALHAAKPNRTLALIGRDPTRLDLVAAACRSRGAQCETARLDVRDGPALRTYLQDFDRRHPVDLLCANAGVLGGRSAEDAIETPDAAKLVLEVNLMATIETVHALLPALRSRRRGKVVLVSSLAAFVPLPDAPAYSAAKAGLLSYGLALRDALASEGVGISVACPGFVQTAMAKVHIGNRPGEVTAAAAAAQIMAGVARDRPVIGFPLLPFWMSRLSLLVPESMRRRGMRATRFHVAGPPR